MGRLHLLVPPTAVSRVRGVESGQEMMVQAASTTSIQPPVDHTRSLIRLCCRVPASCPC
jgi:hypothetical protein